MVFSVFLADFCLKGSLVQYEVNIFIVGFLNELSGIGLFADRVFSVFYSVVQL